MVPSHAASGLCEMGPWFVCVIVHLGSLSVIAYFVVTGAERFRARNRCVLAIAPVFAVLVFTVFFH